MKRDVIDLSIERKLCMLLIANTEFCKAIIPIIKPNLLKTLYAKWVATEVSTFYQTYKVAPEGQIQDIWTNKRSHETDSEALESIGTFLGSIAEEYDPDDYKNLPYWVDSCESYLRLNNIQNLKDKLDALISTGKVDDAESAVATFKQVSVPNTEGVSIISNIDVFQQAFEEQQEALFRLDGDLGVVAGNFYRGDFSAGLASQKAGKSWWLSHLGLEAMSQGCKVLMINYEMRASEMYQRAWKMLNWAPNTDSVIAMPYFKPELEPGEEITDATKYSIAHKNMNKRGVSFVDKEYTTQMLKMRYKGGDIRYVTMPSGSSWQDVEALLDNLAYYSNYMADVLVLDYIDLMSSKEREYRHRMNDLWENARRVAQERHIHVTSVSQTNKSGLSGEEITAADVAEDSRKNSHVAKLLGLYGTPTNRQESFIYVKNLISRYKVDTYDAAVVLQQLDIGRWCVDSKLKERML